jgi:plastocyanin
MRHIRSIVLTTALSGLLVACGGGGGNGGTDGGDGGETTGAVTMVDNAFQPSSLTVASGDTLTVTNEGIASHTFTVPDQGIDEVLEAGAEGSVTISLDAGSYDVICSFHPEMTGTLTVQ